MEGNGTLGGEDIEAFAADDIASSEPMEDHALISANGMGTSSSESFRGEGAVSQSGLVTVPWTPVVPQGKAGRNVKTYVVREGDTLSTIAEAFGVGVRELAWSNNHIVDPDSIQPGDTLRIPPVKGILHVVKEGETVAGIAKRYGADERRIIAFNGIPADGTIIPGDEIVIPDGVAPSPPPPKPAPPPSRPQKPQFAQNRVPFGYFIAPTTGRNWGRIHSHNGVDIANSCGTPVYAAASGTITHVNWSGWGGGYGLYIDISHPNGTSTRYAHLSTIIVGSGSVEQGQLIGLMGTTGRSTGCHLHFEVHGAPNPLAR
jgi:murein DD-endopeptidase MepM/ murein hydrolase activator NlpD